MGAVSCVNVSAWIDSCSQGSVHCVEVSVLEENSIFCDYK